MKKILCWFGLHNWLHERGWNLAYRERRCVRCPRVQFYSEGAQEWVTIK